MSQEHLQEPALQYARQDFPMISDRLTVEESLNIIRREGVGERIIYFYIVNDEGKLVGIIPTRRLLTSTPQQKIAELMINDVVKISHRATVQDACEMFVKHKFFALPIVDDLNYMCGVIDIGFFSQETVSVVEREKIEDIFELIGFGMSQLRGRSALGILRYRLPWLLMLVTSGIVCALLVSAHQTLLIQNLFILLFLILVLGLGESISTQSLTVTLQRLHFEQPTWASFLAWLKEESLVTLLLGIVCGILVGTIAWLWHGQPLTGLTIGSSVLGSVFVAGVIGVTIPTLLHATHEHSKIAAGPVTHALTYVSTALIYLSAARFLLNN
jgi:magnesium transporter